MLPDVIVEVIPFLDHDARFEDGVQQLAVEAFIALAAHTDRVARKEASSRVILAESTQGGELAALSSTAGDRLAAGAAPW